MTRAAKIYDFTMGAGATFQVLAEGSYYRILTSTGAIEVRRDGGSALGPIYAGQGERAQFQRLTLTDKSGSNNVGLIIVADDSFVDDRITGEVSVIDGAKSRTFADLAYNAMAYEIAGAGLYPHGQLWNPSATKNCIVGQIMLSSTVAAHITIRAHNAALLNLSTGQPNPANKRITGPDSVMETRVQSAAAAIGTGKAIAALHVAPSTPSILRLTEPVVIPPSQGLVANIGTVVASTLMVNFEYYEAPI